MSQIDDIGSDVGTIGYSAIRAIALNMMATSTDILIISVFRSQRHRYRYVNDLHPANKFRFAFLQWASAFWAELRSVELHDVRSLFGLQCRAGMSRLSSAIPVALLSKAAGPTYLL